MTTSIKTLSTVAIVSASTIFTTAPASAEIDLSDGLDVVFVAVGHAAPYYVSWLGGFEDALKAYDEAFEDVKITGRWLSPNGVLEKQIQQVEATINEEPDIMFVNAINTAPYEKYVKMAQEKGITWIAVHSAMEAADHSFVLGDFENGYNQGKAMGAYYSGEAKVGIMLGQAGNPSGEERREGILAAYSEFPNIEVLSEQPADWETTKAQSIVENWFTQFPDMDAISVVTDAYLYPSLVLANNAGKTDMTFWGYDGDIPMLQDMARDDGLVKADILLSGTREGWAMIQFAWKIANGIEVPSVYNFYTPLVMRDDTYERVLANGFPEDIEVYSLEQALDVAENGYKEFGPDSVVLPE